MQPGPSASARRASIAPDAQLLCGDARCRRVLPTHVEICDECGGTDLTPLAGARLEGMFGDHAVAFALHADRANVIGRAAEDPVDVDLSRSPESGSVHRRHAEVRREGNAWRVTHLGRNPLVVVRGGQRDAVAPGASAELRSGDRIVVGTIPLRFKTE